MGSITELAIRLHEFATTRDWTQFHRWPDRSGIEKRWQLGRF
jgi:hypothetical protein